MDPISIATSVIAVANSIRTIISDLSQLELETRLLSEKASHVLDIVTPIRDHFQDKYVDIMKSLLRVMKSIKEYLLELSNSQSSKAETDSKLWKLGNKWLGKAKRVYNLDDIRSRIAHFDKELEDLLAQLIATQNNLMMEDMGDIRHSIDEILAGLRRIEVHGSGLGGISSEQLAIALCEVDHLRQRDPDAVSQGVIEKMMQQPVWYAKMQEMARSDRVGGFADGCFPQTSLAMDISERLKVHEEKLDQLINSSTSLPSSPAGNRPSSVPISNSGHSKKLSLLPIYEDLLKFNDGFGWDSLKHNERTPGVFIAAGSFGFVYRVEYDEDLVALKYFGKSGGFLTPSDLDLVRREVLVLQKLRHRNIISL